MLALSSAVIPEHVSPLVSVLFYGRKPSSKYTLATQLCVDGAGKDYRQRSHAWPQKFLVLQLHFSLSQVQRARNQHKINVSRDAPLLQFFRPLVFIILPHLGVEILTNIEPGQRKAFPYQCSPAGAETADKGSLFIYPSSFFKGYNRDRICLLFFL